jgi:hypothetical protein
MFVNLSPECRQQLLGLVQTLRLSEADVIAFAIQQLFEERNLNRTHRVRKPGHKVKAPA